MTTLKQAATIELRIHVHSLLHEILMTNAGLKYDQASRRAYDLIKGRRLAWLAAINRRINAGAFDQVTNETDVIQAIS